jgi:hypothetical protein
MRRKLLIGFAALALAAVVAVPVAQAAVPPIKRFPKFFTNGVKENSARKPAITVGAIRLHNGILGDLECQNMFAGVTYNENTEGTEKGLTTTTGYGTFNCVAAAPCKVKNTKGEEVEGIYLTAESPPEPAGTEAHPTGITSLPWMGEVIERETGRLQMLTHHVKIWEVLPPETVGKGLNCLGLEVAFEDLEGPTEKEAGYELAPIWVNGTKNGLKPSHEEFLGETGQTEKGREFPVTGKLKSRTENGGTIGDGFLASRPSLITGGLGGGWELITVE